MTPTVLLALIDRMSPQELINNLGALKRRGAFDNPELKALIEAKLQEAKTAERVSAFKAEEAMKAADLSDDVKRSLEQVADAQVKAKGRIDRPTALLIDKSGSMSVAIELGKRIGALVSSVSAQALYVYAFDTLAYPIQAAGPDLAAWEAAIKGITAGGGTSCGVARRDDAPQEAVRRADHPGHRRGREHRSPVRRDPEEVPRGGQGRPQRLLRPHARGRHRSWRSSAARRGSWSTRSSSRATTTRCRTWCRCCRGRRSWICCRKSWSTRCRSASRRERGSIEPIRARADRLSLQTASLRNWFLRRNR